MLNRRKNEPGVRQGGRLGNNDPTEAGRTIDLRAARRGICGNVLPADRTGKFKLAHECPVENFISRHESNLVLSF